MQLAMDGEEKSKSAAAVTNHTGFLFTLTMTDKEQVKQTNKQTNKKPN